MATLNNTILSTVKHQNANNINSVKSAFIFNNTVDNYLIAQLKAIMPNAETIPPDYILYVAWLKAQIDNKTIVGQPVTADSNKVILTGNPNEAALKPFGIDIDPSKIEINDLDGVLDIIKGGTGLSTIGTAGQLIRVDSLGTALEYFTANYGTVSSVALTMPSAFSVSGSPVTTSGTLAVTGAGTTGQYIRGDGTLANFPTVIGGGASISYYLNGSINQGTFSGNTYYQMSKTPVIGTGTNFTINSNGYIAQFITDVNDPSQLNIPAGNWNFEMYFQASSAGGSPSFYVELYKWDGTAFTLIASSSTNPEGITNGTATDLYTTALAVPSTTLSLTDRLAVRVYVNNGGRTITLHTEDNNLCQVITTFTTGITAINGLTAQVQTFATGTSGTDFNIVSSGSTHTFNLPTASATNRGALSSADWSTFNNKGNGTVTSISTAGLISGGTITTTGTITTSINSNRLVGRGSAGIGIFEEIILGTGLSLSGNTLNASGGNLTIGTTPIASGTIGRVLFEGVGNVLQENSNLNFDTTNGLIIGGATARGTRLTVVNSANTQATKVFVQRNAADSADYTTLRGDGSVDFANIGSTANVLVYANGSALIQTYGSAGLRNSLFGLANATSITGGTVAYNTFVGAESTLSSSTATTAYNTAVGFTTNITNANNCTIVGTFTRMNGANRAIVIGGRSTAGPVRDVTGTDVILFGYGTDANALNYTNSAVFYFNNANASIWFQSNGNLGLFGKKYQILNDSTGTAANRLSTYMDINATNTLTIHNGTPTSSQIADAVQVYGADVVAGNTALFVRTENNDIVKIYSIGGWGTPTGTLTRTTFDTATVTLAQLAERVAALISDLKTGHQLLKS